MPGRGGARAALREAGEEAGEKLARQGARQADEGWKFLYRAVSMEELEDIVSYGVLRGTSGTLEGKWFAEYLHDAFLWGKQLWKLSSRTRRSQPSSYAVIRVRVRRELLPFLEYRAKLDGIGPAFYAPPGLLPAIQFVEMVRYLPILR